MEVTKENVGQAIAALRQCAKEHKSDKTDTGKIIVTSLCNDIADYLEKIKNLSLIEMPSEEEICDEAAIRYPSTWNGKTNSEGGYEIPQGFSAFIKAIEWLKSKIVK